MKKLVTRYYYTWGELISILQDANYNDPEKAKDHQDSWNQMTGLSSLIASTLGTVTNANTMLQSYCWPEFWDSYIMYIDVEHDPWTDPVDPTDSEIIEASLGFRSRVARWIIESSERYNTLIDAYNDIKTSLMNRIGNKSTVLFNDTPQASNGTFFSGDNYVSNVSQTSTETDTTTPILRLKEVEDNLANLYAEWSDEFSRFVIYSVEE